MRYLAEIRPAGLLVLDRADRAALDPLLRLNPLLALLALGEIAQMMRAASLGIRADPLDLLPR